MSHCHTKKKKEKKKKSQAFFNLSREEYNVHSVLQKLLKKKLKPCFSNTVITSRGVFI